MKMYRLLFLVAIFLLGCQMDQRFSKLQVGMTKAQVMTIVGKQPTGHTVEGNIEKLQWETGNHYAKFKNGRLTDYGSE